ncbi:unnamed protein product [Prorocentrum cordatum]|uniref:Uncharacterized protein n=1 Tax=Prorocentrum cordatum TaxID=2364126 RepID=A0ABN9TR86_9DINO|nr:unnamed protein product [Polarella glacialis]
MLAHASIYFPDTCSATEHRITSNEMGNVLASVIFLAHCWVEDETCPLRIWHQHLFAQYCSLGTLSSAVLRLMELRGYILRLSSEVVERRTHALLAAREAAARACTPVPRPLLARSGYIGTHWQGSTFLRRGLDTILDTCVSRARTDDG